MFLTFIATTVFCSSILELYSIWLVEWVRPAEIVLANVGPFAAGHILGAVLWLPATIFCAFVITVALSTGVHYLLERIDVFPSSNSKSTSNTPNHPTPPNSKKNNHLNPDNPTITKSDHIKPVNPSVTKIKPTIDHHDDKHIDNQNSKKQR